MDDSPAPAAPDGKPRFWRTVLIFALAGPYIGLAISLFVMGVVGLVQGQPTGRLAGGLLSVGVLSAVFAIPVGAAPAALTGLVAARMQRLGTAPRRYYALTGAVGALSILVIPLILRTSPEFWIFVGAGTALICARLTRAR